MHIYMPVIIENIDRYVIYIQDNKLYIEDKLIHPKDKVKMGITKKDIVDNLISSA